MCGMEFNHGCSFAALWRCVISLPCILALPCITLACLAAHFFASHCSVLLFWMRHFSGPIRVYFWLVVRASVSVHMSPMNRVHFNGTIVPIFHSRHSFIFIYNNLYKSIFVVIRLCGLILAVVFFLLFTVSSSFCLTMSQCHTHTHVLGSNKKTKTPEKKATTKRTIFAIPSSFLSRFFVFSLKLLLMKLKWSNNNMERGRNTRRCRRPKSVVSISSEHYEIWLFVCWTMSTKTETFYLSHICARWLSSYFWFSLSSGPHSLSLSFYRDLNLQNTCCDLFNSWS